MYNDMETSPDDVSTVFCNKVRKLSVLPGIIDTSIRLDTKTALLVKVLFGKVKLCHLKFIYLFGRQRDRFSIYCFTPQMPTIAGNRPSQSQEPELNGAMQVHKTQVLEPSLAASQDMQ